MPEFTGERVVPGLVDIDLLNEHLARYRFALRYAEGARVLDAGCGSGYGTAVLAQRAQETVGIDISPGAVAYARENFPLPRLRFEEGRCDALPEGPFDLITAFEVIEHLAEWPKLLEEARRALAPGGVFLVSTPNKRYYSESRGIYGANPFHVHEFDFDEFQRELAAVFPQVQMWLQNHVEAVSLAPVAPAALAELALEEAAPRPQEAHFFLAVCGDELPQARPMVWVPETGNVLRERERHIAKLEREVALRSRWFEETKAELDERNREFEDVLGRYRQANRDLEARNLWGLEWQARAEEHGRRILALQDELNRESALAAQTVGQYESKVAELEEVNLAKTEWALDTERRLGVELDARSNELARAVDLLHEAEATVVERTEWARALERESTDWHARFQTLKNARWVRWGERLRILAARP